MLYLSINISPWVQEIYTRNFSFKNAIASRMRLQLLMQRQYDMTIADKLSDAHDDRREFIFARRLADGAPPLAATKYD